MTNNSYLPASLPKLLGPEAADSIQTEAKNQPVLFSQTHVKRRKLRRHGAAVPTMAQRHRGADKRAVASSGSLLEVKEE